MVKKSVRWKTLLGAAAVLSALSLAYSAPPSSDQIDRWLRQLDDEDFTVREEATVNLIKSGKAVIEPVTAAAQGKSLEATDRCVRILRELSLSDDRGTSAAARAAIAKLAAGDHKQAADKARVVQRERQQKIAEKLEEKGVRAFSERDGRVTSLTFDKAKDFDIELDLLTELADVAVVHMNNPLVADAAVAKLKVLPKLDYLDLFQSGITDESLKHFKDMPALKMIPMGRTKITDAGLVHLKELSRLEYIGLRGDAITDAGLAHLATLTNLAALNLSETKITDAGLVHLKKMSNLHRLYVNGTSITDEGLKNLECLPGLEELFLANTKVTAEGIKKLKNARPGLQVIEE